MSLKDLFKKQGNKFLKPTSKNELGKEIESTELLEAYSADKDTFIPAVDFEDPENFARYGSAKKYYTDAFTRITNEYPYDGSASEKTRWYLSSSYIDKHIYDNEYPRTNGFVHFSPTGWGATNTIYANSGSSIHLGMPASREYILIKGGPNADPDENVTSVGSTANIYNLDKNRTSNLRLNPISGSTVEFWLKIDALPNRGRGTGNDADANGQTDRMSLFDLWNGVTGSSNAYGRFEIYINNDGTGSNAAFGIHAISGTVGTAAGVEDSFIGFNSVSASAGEGLFSSYTQDNLTDGKWHHYAFVLKNSGSDLTSQLFVDGQKEQTITKASEALNEIEGAMLACIGANVAYPDFIADPGTAASANGRGLSKLSGSMDEFRYWKTKRSEKEIGRYWFTQVHGGTNTRDENVDLGVYYKFNEGITGTGSVDSTVLDYSGRISNGTWFIESGMTGSIYRETDSALTASAAATEEFKDPIIYDYHPDVKSRREKLESSGSLYDDTNAASLYNSVPEWIRQGDDSDKELENLTQIMASYFDTLHLQIEALPGLKNVNYQTGSHKPYFFNQKLLDNTGFDTSELFYDEDFLQNFDDRDDDRLFRDKLHNIKNTIYSNIYNNLVFINKSKGTEKSFRNLIRCFGIDEEQIKLSMYANNATYTLEDSYQQDAKIKKLVNFDSGSSVNGTRVASVYQYTDPDNSNSTSYIYGSKDDAGDEVYTPITTEAEIYFPKRAPESSVFHNPYLHESSSLFGCFTAKANAADYTTETGDAAGFQVYSVRKETVGDVADCYFYLTGTHVPALESELFENVYDNEKWNFAVRFRHAKEPLVNEVTGTFNSGSVNDIVVEFHGINTEAGVIKRQFTVSGTFDADTHGTWGAGGDSFFTERRRFYAGAHRTNAAGTLQTATDVKFSYLRHWLSNVDNEEIKSHALSVDNYGVKAPLRNTSIFDFNRGSEVPKIETLALNWSFSNLTGSDDDGQFLVIDESSGSAGHAERYGWLSNITKKQHTGLGINFPGSKTTPEVVQDTYIPTLKQTLPENLQSTETVKVLSFDDEMFTKESRPVNYFFALEKSPYQNISQEMLNFFATIKDFNNLIGEPINRYRQSYKDIEKLRNLFFERIENTPSVEKYINFYKWIDSSISEMLKNLTPASANFADDLRTVIESHSLERNKYWSKLPTIEYKPKADPESAVKGIKELTYNWKTGHAPLTQDERDNCLWWKDRAPRDVQAFATNRPGIDDSNFLSSSNEDVNLAKKDILQAIITNSTASNPKLTTAAGTTYQGSDYAIRKLSRVANFSMNPVMVNAGSGKNKKRTLWKTELKHASAVLLNIPSSSLAKVATYSCQDLTTGDDDKRAGLNKQKYAFKVFNSEKLDTGYLEGPGELLVPFSLYSSSVQQGYSRLLPTFSSHVQVTNLHSDWHTGEEPMQGPFTEKYVGGHQYRHADLNYAFTDGENGRSLDKAYDAPNRPEGFIIQIFTNAIFIRHASLDIDDQSYNPSNPTAKYYRDEVAKRPVNIRNIRQGTGSVAGGVTVIGNYEKNYQVVHTSGRNVNNLWLRTDDENDRTPQLTPEVWTLWGNVPDTGEDAGGSTRQYRNALDFTLPDRDGKDNKTVIAERFSAPGGREVLARGFLDPGTETFSVYNSMNYRNSAVRTTYNKAQTSHMGQFGLLSGTINITDVEGDDNSYEIFASNHKVNRNSRYRYKERGNLDIELADGIPSGSWDIVPVHDNAYVQHIIPQNERQYAWITASLGNRSEPVESSPNSLVVTSDGLAYDSKTSTWSNPFTWVTSSDFGVYIRPGFAVLGTPFSNQAGVAASSFVSGDFAGLNTIVVDNLDTSDNSVGSDALLSANNRISSSVNHSFVTTISGKSQPNWDPALASASGDSEDAAPETIFNLLMLNRNGPGGWSSWKQTRLSRHPLARNMRKNNRISLMDPSNPKKFGALLVGGPPNQKGTQERQTISFTEPAVGFNNHPLEYNFGSGAFTSVKVSYQNIKETFANSIADNSLLNKVKNNGDYPYDLESIRTGYEDLLPVYTAENADFDLDTLEYTQTIFPRNTNAGLGKVRTRQNYAETAGSDTEGTGLDHQDRNTFWRDKRTSRGLTRSQAKNSFGYIDHGQGRSSLSGTQLSVWPMSPVERGNLDDGYERSNFFGELYPSGTYVSLYTTASVSFMRSIASRSTSSTDNEFPQVSTGKAMTFSVYAEGGGVPARLNKYNAHLTRKVNSGINLKDGAGYLYVTEPRNPWYDSYEDYSQDIKLMGQGYSVIPEFKISDHIDYYVDTGGNFQKTNNKILSLKGADVTSSANNETDKNLNNSFFTTYSNSDFMKHFDVIRDDHESTDYRTSKITMRCAGIKKLLPYNGFYPVTRTTQLAGLLSQSLGTNLEYLYGSSHTGSGVTGLANSLGTVTDFKPQRLNAFMQPLFAPGVLYNSIKAGIAVDYPVHTGNVTPALDLSQYAPSASYALECIADRPNYRIPFEALINLQNYIPKMVDPKSPTSTLNDASMINYMEPNFINSTEAYLDDDSSGISGEIERADIGPKVFSQWTGEIKPQFEMAMNNFLGETVRFFLKDQNLKSYTSKQEKDFKSMAVGSSYYMDIVLRKTENFVSSEGVLEDQNLIETLNSAAGGGTNDSENKYRSFGTMHFSHNDHRGYIYGPAYTHLGFRRATHTTSSTATSSTAAGTAYAPHSPPYLFGESIARVKFTPPSDEGDLSRPYTVREILDNSTITYFNTHPELNKPALEAAASPDDLSDTSLEWQELSKPNHLDLCPALLDQMVVSSSVILDATVRDPVTAFDSAGKPMSIAQQVGSTDNDRWVIYPRWECPALNVSSSNSSSIRSIWNDYGRIPQGNEGIFMEIRESFPELVNTKNSLTKSLVDVMGFDATNNLAGQRLGELAEEKEISEAIVAIPYFTSKVSSIKSGIETINLFSNYHFVKINKDVFKLTRENIEAGGPAIKAGDDPLGFTGYGPEAVVGKLIPKNDIKTTSISDMIEKMKKYVLPPKFNFLRKTKGAQPHPFVMYLFEFNHVLDKQDLCDIWNNIMPDIAVTAEKQESVISHDIGPYEFFGSKPSALAPGINQSGGSGLLSQMSPFTLTKEVPNLRWMIFKVKKRAEVSYSNITLSAEDDTDFKFTFDGKSGAKTPDYSYNWPYDFFSLVELAKIETSVEIKNRENDG